MNSNQPPNDDVVEKSLRDWRVSAPLPPRFNDRVWRRIEQAEASGHVGLWNTLQEVLAGLFMRRAWAASYLSIALAAGLALGYWQVHADASQSYSSMSQRYVQSLDPYQKAGH